VTDFPPYTGSCSRWIGWALAAFALPAAAYAGSPVPQWPDTPFVRVAALALIEELRADLLSETSATATLEHWCGAHGIAATPRIVAERQRGDPVPPSPEQRARLRVTAADAIGYRHVRLTCGERVLSEAENWYVPSRLTPEMNRMLDTTDTPFGKAVQALGFQRATLSSRLLWRPLPEAWTATPLNAGGGTITIPERLIENRALLSRGADQLPIAEVAETYTSDVLAFPPPASR
jgi:chorismate-pyruvate lyase